MYLYLHNIMYHCNIIKFVLPGLAGIESDYVYDLYYARDYEACDTVVDY